MTSQRLTTAALLLLPRVACRQWQGDRRLSAAACKSAGTQPLQRSFCSSNQQHAGNNLTPGASYSLRKCFSQEDVERFLAFTGDANPIHSQDSAARAAGFEAPVLPGILLASLFPAIIGTHFHGALYLTQSLAFKAPAQVGCALEAVVTVTKVSGRRAVFDTRCFVLSGDDPGSPTPTAGRRLLVDGSALALLPSQDPAPLPAQP